MKKVIAIAITIALTGVSFGSQAADRKEQEMALCTAELKAYYGPETQIDLVSRKRGRNGSDLRVAARVDADHSHFSQCWVSSDDLATLDSEEASEQVATVPPASP